MQRCRLRNPNLNDFNMYRRMIPIQQATGVYSVARIQSLQQDQSLISALAERTLKDVGILLGLPIDGAPVICPVSPAAGMSWATIIYAIFRHLRLNNRFNDSRIQLIWFKQITPHGLGDDASDEEIRHHTRCYSMQLLGGSLLTDHPSIICGYTLFVDAFGLYAWGLAVLAHLYIEL